MNIFLVIKLKETTMLNSMIELNQKEIDLISGGENEPSATIIGGDNNINSTAIDSGGNNAPTSTPPAQPSSYSEAALVVASEAGKYAWYAGEAMLALAGVTAICAIVVTTVCVAKKKWRR
jgi:hypothetical protein